MGPPRHKKFRQQKSAAKVMAIVFWDAEGIIHTDYVQQGSIVNANYYCNVLDKLHGTI